MVNTTSKILEQLKKHEKEEGNLPLLLEFYRKLLKVQLEAEKRIGTPVPGLSSESLQQRLQNQRPMLSFNDLTLDWTLVRGLFVKVISVFSGYPELFGEIPERLKKPGSGRLLSKKAVKAWFIGNELPTTISDSISESLIQTIIQATLQPFLASYAEALISSVEQEKWRQPRCPICGGNPDLAFLEKEHGARWLLCSRCNSKWLFQRLECPYCDTKDQKSLTFFTDEEGLYRLYVCDQCKCYLKAIDLRKAEPETLLPLERIYTLDIDRQAREQGYHSC
ncbi:formate dehydrogenase accessory protein FdhE [Chloroflexota bacterium]